MALYIALLPFIVDLKWEDEFASESCLYVSPCMWVYVYLDIDFKV